MLAPLTAACLTVTAYAYQIPQSYLYAILATEGGHVGQEVGDRNGTSDLGPFQINSRWGREFTRYWQIPIDEALQRLRDDGCANAIAAAAILRGYTVEAGGDLVRAVGLYHSHTPTVSDRYREAVLGAARRFPKPPSEARSGPLETTHRGAY